MRQIRGRRPEADLRSTFHGSWKRAEHDVDGRRLFVIVERVNIGQAPSRLRKNSMYTQNAVGIFHMARMSKQAQDVQKGRPTIRET
jgi:hypothetical protein